MKYNFSVIIATYNRGEALCNMLDSLFKQEIQPFEIILIDQTQIHSDKTKEFLNKYSNKVNRIIQSEPNLPLARNTGLNISTTDIVLFIDDDIILPIFCFNNIVPLLTNKVIEGICGLFNFEMNKYDLYKSYNINLNEKKLVFVNQFIGAFMAFRKEIFEKVGYFDINLGRLSSSNYGEDIDFLRRVKKHNYILAIDPTLIIFHPLGINGGCESRELTILEALRKNLSANLYIEMKNTNNNGNINLNGWLRILRGFLLNKNLFKTGILHTFNKIKILYNNYYTTQDFFLKNK